jgi:PAS domain S-box-containing protein
LSECFEISKRIAFSQRLIRNMIKKFISHIILFVILFQYFGTQTLSAQDNDKTRAIWIVQNFCPNVFWSDENSISNFVIGVYGSETNIFNELVELSKTKTIKEKKFTVVQFKKVRDITPVQVLFVESSSNGDVKSIFEKITYNTLLITDQCPDNGYIMINFLASNSKKRFEINRKNALDGGISYSDNMLVHGGDEVVIKEIYTKTENQLQKEKQKLEKQRALLAKQTADLSILNADNDKERKENERQKEINSKQITEMKNQQKQLEDQRSQMDIVQRNLAVLQGKLISNSKQVNDQIKNINIKEKLAKEKNAKIQSQIAEIEKNKKLIAAKDTLLVKQSSHIDFQIKLLIGFLVLTLFALVLAFFIWRGYKIKQKINDELRDKNDAINKQKEEIANQQYHTELLNKELEKLSIVASRTDNAVTIMDVNGNFEWINIGFTRLYGYTLQLLKNELDENIRGVNQNPEINSLIEQCISSKKTVVFESKNHKRNGSELWVQTSLTPIVNSDEEISKLITIETDISNIKNAEREIRLQNEKILEQTIELEASNKELEKLSLVASGTDNAIAIMDAAGNFQWINDGFSRLFGYSYIQLVSDYSKNIIANNTPVHVKELIKQSIEETTPVTYELLQKTREGKEVWVQTNLTPITDKNKNIKYLISISIDISQLKKAEQAIRQQSEELMAQKEELVLQKDRIELQNQHIKSSITYAKTIQNAILPTLTSLNQDFNTFVIYKPKDIVSGDFYWYSKLHNGYSNKEKFFYATVDCTGHGVPGAFMSMIGSRILNEIVNEKKIDKPSKILDLMNNEIKHILRQEETDNNDGMDICLCAIESGQNGYVNVTFAGAKRPLYYFKNSDKTLNYIKGTRKTIGGTHAKRNTEVFQDHEVTLEKGDLIYLSTDGIVDQPSPERIRFGSMRFINLLKNIAEKPLQVQKETIEQAVVDFQEYEQQRDDVTFLGIKV